MRSYRLFHRLLLTSGHCQLESREDDKGITYRVVIWGEHDPELTEDEPEGLAFTIRDFKTREAAERFYVETVLRLP